MKQSRTQRVFSHLRRPVLGGARGVVAGAGRQLWESVVEPAPVLIAASAMVGAAVVLGLDAILRPNAVAPHLNSVISYLITRELVPILAGVILALRSGPAVAVALRLASAASATSARPESAGNDAQGQGSRGVDLLPRAVGLIASAIVLTAVMTAAALVGGYLLIALIGRVPQGVRLGSILGAITRADVAIALGKAALAGLVVAIVSALHGLGSSDDAGASADADPRSDSDIAKAAGNGALQAALGCVGLLVLASVADATSGLSKSGGSGDNGDFVVYAMSADGYGTRVGAAVKVRGVEAGTVTDLALVHDPAHAERPVRITMRIDPHAASFLFDRTVAQIDRIQMGPGVPPFAVPPIELRTAGDAPLAPGSTVIAVGTETMVDSFVQLGHDVASVRAMLDGLSEPLKDLRTITSALARSDGAAGRFINDPTTAAEMSAMLDGAVGATVELKKALADAHALSAQAGPLLTEIQGASKDGRDALAGAATAARDLPRVLRATERTLKIAEELVVNLRAASVYAPELARKVDASLEETNRVVDAAQRSLILRNTVPDRQQPRTEEEVRPPVPIAPAQKEEVP